MEYKDIKTPEQLLKYMDENISFGFVDNDGKVYGSWDNQEFQKGCQTKWHLSSPERLIKVKYGHCLDQVELERYWFKTHNYEFKTFYIRFKPLYNEFYFNHSYLVYEDCGKYYYFEHSDCNNRGIHEFASYEDAINYQKEKHIENTKQRKIVDEEESKYLFIYEYDNPMYGCTKKEFNNHILENDKQIEIEKPKTMK